MASFHVSKDHNEVQHSRERGKNSVFQEMGGGGFLTKSPRVMLRIGSNEGYEEMLTETESSCHLRALGPETRVT